jgi:predicted aminopeptidase
VLALSGCSTASYLVHVSVGQLRYLLDRERIADVELEPGEQRGLETLRRAQAHGEAAGLAASTSYRHVIDRDDDNAVRVVTAAPPDRLEPVTWWFPIVGSISYRGYFDDARARAFAALLESEGYDTHVRPAIMYSTLGWFDDPIPLAVLRWPEVDLAEVALHEQVHETVFVADDAGYNEALASFIARHAVLGLFADEPERQQQAAALQADRARFAALLEALYAELETLYAETNGPDEARERRAAVFARYQGERFRAIDWQTRRYAGFPGVDLDNSYLLARRTYQADGPCFEAELEALGGDLPAFVAAHVADPGHRACPEVDE